LNLFVALSQIKLIYSELIGIHPQFTIIFTRQKKYPHPFNRAGIYIGGIQPEVKLMDKMDNQMILQMLLPFLSAGNKETLLAFQEMAELQQLIISHANSGRKNWRSEMLIAIRPKLPDNNRHMVDILIKCMELTVLLEKGCAHHGHRQAF